VNTFCASKNHKKFPFNYKFSIKTSVLEITRRQRRRTHAVTSSHTSTNCACCLSPAATNSCTAATAATYAYEASRRTRRVRAQAIASACTVLPYVYVCPLLKYSNSHLQYEIKIQQFTTTSSSVQLCCEIANTLALTGNQQDEPQLSAVNGCNRRLRSANTKKLSVQRTTVIGTSR